MTLSALPGRASDRVLIIGTLLVLFLAPSQFSIELAPKTFLSPVDPLIWALFGLWFLLRWREKRLLDIAPPAWGALVLVVAAVISIPGAATRSTAVKDTIQLVEYVILAYILFQTAARHPVCRGWLIALFRGLSSLIVAWAMVHYASKGADFDVRGTFGNSSVLGGFLALSVPFWAGECLWTRSWKLRVWDGLIVLGGIGVTLSGGTLVALTLSVLVMGALRGRRAFWIIAALVLLIGIGLSQLPRQNLSVARASIALYNQNGEASPRYPEWQAATSMALDNPWTGTGIGNYQANIGIYYGVLPDPAGRTSEADSQNLYLVLAGSLGWMGLLGMLGLLLSHMITASQRSLTSDQVLARAIGLGGFGSVLAFAINSLWSPLLVRGIGVPLVFILALIASLRSNRTPQ